MAKGKGQMARGKWQGANDKGQIAKSKGQMANDKGQKARGKRQMARGKRQKARGKLAKVIRSAQCSVYFSTGFGCVIQVFLHIPGSCWAALGAKTTVQTHVFVLDHYPFGLEFAGDV